MKVKITERGWAGHFIATHCCRFKRNTLIEKGKKRIVVSTVGAYYPSYPQNDTIDTIGHERWYETMVFKARKEGPYWDADVKQDLTGKIKGDWGIWGKTAKELPSDVDNKANEMHDRIVKQFADRRGECD